MAIRVAINGFGRIGRNILRAIAESGRKDIEVVGSTISARSRPTPICCASTPCTAVSRHRDRRRRYDQRRQRQDQVSAERDPTKLPWKELGVDIAMECTGIFSAKAKAVAHLTAGAKRVLVAALRWNDETVRSACRD